MRSFPVTKLVNIHRLQRTIKLVALILAAIALVVPQSVIRAQSFTFNELTAGAQNGAGTDGVNVIALDSVGNINIIPFAGGAATTLVAIGTPLPNGLGVATSFKVAGPPVLRGGLVYFSAQSNIGSGYYSIPMGGGVISVIVDSTTKDAQGRSIRAAALPTELIGYARLFGGPLAIPGVDNNLFVPSSGGAIFTASLYTTDPTTADLAILSLSPTGDLTTVVDSNLLSGCGTISNFTTDGSIYAAWAISSSNHVLLLENDSPALDCGNVLLDLGIQGTNATGILPGQPSAGSIVAAGFAPSTVIDSGLLYFSATIALVDKTNNAGSYSGIYRVQPGGNVQKVVGTDNSLLGTTGSPDGSGANPLYLCNSFSVRGDYVVVEPAWVGHYGLSAPLYGQGYYLINQATGTIQEIAKASEILSAGESYYLYNTNILSESSLTTDQKFVFAVSTEGSGSGAGPDGQHLYSVNLAASSTTSVLTASPTTEAYGTPVTLTATVTSSGAVTPTGTVTFTDGSTSLGSSALSAGGVAALSVNLAAGNHSVSSSYTGDSANAPSTATTTLGVDKAATSLALSSSSSAVPATGSLTLTATLSGLSTVPAEYIMFDDGTTVLAGAGGLLGTGGVAQFVTSGLPPGAHYLTASFAGDSNYLPSTSSDTVINASAVSTSVVLSSSLETAPIGTTVTLTALITASQGAPMGTVNFTSNGMALGSGAVDSSGSAVIAVNNLPSGTDNIQAVFVGGAFYPGSTSNSVSLVITGTPTFNITSSTQSLSIKQGESGTATISIVTVGGFSSPTQFSCSGLPAFATCNFSPPSLTPSSGANSTTLTVATNVQGTPLQQTHVRYAGFLLLGLGGLFRLRRSRMRRGLLSILTVIVMGGGLSGCGGGGSTTTNPVTPVGSSSVMVIATSGSTTQTLALLITISQ